MKTASYVDEVLRAEIGLKLRVRLKELKLTQEEAAARVKVHRTAFNRYLNGKATPRGEMLAKLCDEFGLTLRVGAKDLCARDFSKRKPERDGAERGRQYELAFGQPIVFQVENGAVTFEIKRKPSTRQVELTVRFTNPANIPA